MNEEVDKLLAGAHERIDDVNSRDAEIIIALRTLVDCTEAICLSLGELMRAIYQVK